MPTDQNTDLARLVVSQHWRLNVATARGNQTPLTSVETRRADINTLAARIEAEGLTVESEWRIDGTTLYLVVAVADCTFALRFNRILEDITFVRDVAGRGLAVGLPRPGREMLALDVTPSDDSALKTWLGR